MRTYSRHKTKIPIEITLSTPNLLKMAQNDLARKKNFRLRLTGQSMFPTLQHGDWVTIEPITPNQLTIGDIVLLASSSQTALVHRVIHLEEQETITYLLTRGDATHHVDVAVPVSHVVGRVILIDRGADQINLRTLWQRLHSRFLGWKLNWQLHRLKNRVRGSGFGV